MNLVQPTFLVDKNKVINNIQSMSTKAKRNNLQFRPHFKTHQSADIANWFRDYGINKITVSSLDMALYFAKNGWGDITVAFPVNILEIEKIKYLSEKITLNLLVESEEVVKYLDSNLSSLVNIFIKVDIGYGRTGINHKDFDKITKVKDTVKVSNNLQLVGILSHAGHTYNAKSRDEIIAIKEISINRMVELKSNLGADLILSYGDTPSCSISDEFENIDEIRPGNFVFYDVMQYNLYVCNFNQIACAVAAPIVSKPSHDKLVIYGGGIHLSKERINKDGKNIFGAVVNLNENNTWNSENKNLELVSLSQEHGIIKSVHGSLEKYQPGDIIGIIPIHSCMTANLYKNYFTCDGEIISKI